MDFSFKDGDLATFKSMIKKGPIDIETFIDLVYYNRLDFFNYYIKKGYLTLEMILDHSNKIIFYILIYRSDKILNRILELGIDKSIITEILINNNCLEYCRSLEFIKFLMEIEIVTIDLISESYGDIFIHACMGDNLETMKFLLESGLILNDEQIKESFKICCRNDYEESVEFMLNIFNKDKCLKDFNRFCCSEDILYLIDNYEPFGSFTKPVKM